METAHTEIMKTLVSFAEATSAMEVATEVGVGASPRSDGGNRGGAGAATPRPPSPATVAVALRSPQPLRMSLAAHLRLACRTARWPSS